MKYFTMYECIYSKTAEKMHIDNTPSAENKAHIVETVETLLDPLREAWGKHCIDLHVCSGIRISSGYRCPELNKAVHGSPTSAHCYGYAFDLIPLNGRMMEFKRFCREFLAKRAFDQLISEVEDKNGMPNWMHVGYKHPNGTKRREFLSMIDGKYYSMTE